MSEERFLEIYETLTHNGYGPLDRELAAKLKFRPLAMRKLPLETRARRAKAHLLHTKNAEITYELFGSYLVNRDKAILTDFLDATDVPHEEGIIENVEEGKPAADKIPAAVAALDEKYAANDVTLYLAISAEHWPDVDAMQKAWSERGAE
ncbi:MAG: hypothetical protein AAF682_06920 [Planctomycetota bacterium]